MEGFLATRAFEEDGHEDKQAKRNVEVRWSAVLFAACLVSSWTLGAAGVSWAWLAVLLSAAVAAWRSCMSRVVEATKLTLEGQMAHRKQALRQEETTEWMNFLISRWCTFSSSSINNWIKTTLEPMLNFAKPNFLSHIEVTEFNVGEQMPVIKGIKAFDITGGRWRPASAQNGLARSVRQQIAIEADVAFNSEEFNTVLKARLGGQSVGLDVDIVVDRLHVSGRLYIAAEMDMDAPFPHLSRVTFTFMERPEVWFNINILKAVPMMEIPVLKSWLHSIVLDTLTTWLVDPSHLDINLAPECLVPAQKYGDQQAQGVLIVSLSSPLGGNRSDNVSCWLGLQLGCQKHATSRVSGEQWQERLSFVVTSLQDDCLTIKIKTKRFLTALTKQQFEYMLSSFSFDNGKIVETVVPTKPVKRGCNPIQPITVTLEYFPLPMVYLDKPMPVPDDSKQVAGILSVYMHAATVMAIPDQSSCPNPYCILFNNRQKVKTTHYVQNSTSPQWDSVAEFLVDDYTRANLSFVVCSWDNKKITEDTFLGFATVTPTLDTVQLVRRVLVLSGNSATGGQSHGTVTVSVVFRPVAAVAMSTIHTGFVASPRNNQGVVLRNEQKRNSQNFVQHAKLLLTHSRDSDASKECKDIVDMLATGLGLMEVTLVRARDLIAKDFNGFSDPYCELRVNNECKFKTSIKKKTLNPTWEESVVTNLPRPNEVLNVILWDHDTFGMKDFLGSIVLNLENIRQLSLKDTPEWITLNEVKTGAVEIRIKIITEHVEASQLSDTRNTDVDSAVFTDRASISSQKADSESCSVAATSPAPLRRRNVSKLHLPLPPGGKPVPPPVVPVRKTSTLTTVKPSEQQNGCIGSNIPVLAVTEHCDGRSPSNGNSTPTTSSLNGDAWHDLTIEKPRETIPVKNRLAMENRSFKAVKQRVVRGLSQPLRRFRSEVNVDSEAKQSVNHVEGEPRGGGEADATELLSVDYKLSHALSQPNLMQGLQRKGKLAHMSPTEKYFGIEGKVIQAQGLHLSHANQLYCRVKVSCVNSPSKNSRKDSGKTISKSRIIPAVPSPNFDLEFYLDSTEGIGRNSLLQFDVLTPRKEVIATARIALHELFCDTGPDMGEVRTWLPMSSGASLEIEACHGRESRKNGSGRKLFRSWSVHRIGKV